jgi:hypothetical protein
MKIFFFFLGCFMLYLSCLPCSDSKECNGKGEERISVNTNHKEHNHNKEGCTPFCTCSCCAISAFFAPYYKASDTKVAFQSVRYPLYDVALNTEVYYSIWQPPKLS